MSEYDGFIKPEELPHEGELLVQDCATELNNEIILDGSRIPEGQGASVVVDQNSVPAPSIELHTNEEAVIEEVKEAPKVTEVRFGSLHFKNPA